jgi:hypothetical protein
MNILRRYRLVLLSIALCTVASPIATPLAAQASTKDPTASALLKATKSVIAKEASVHVTHVTKTGSATTSIVADVGKHNGTERITSGSGHVTITVTPDYVYLSGNSAGLVSIMGLTAADQKKVGSESISMKAGTTPYTDLASSATISLVDLVLPAAKGTTVSTKNVNNKKFYALKWTISATSTSPKAASVMTITEGKLALPFNETVTATSGVATTTFSRWGELIKAVAPPSSTVIAYAKVFG